MRLVRSDEVPDRGEVVELDTLEALAADWYGDRLHPDWKPRTLEESQAILDRHGLIGAFWSLAP